MRKRNKYIPLYEAEPGMILGAPVRLIRQGQLVLSFSKGQELTQASIEQLMAHGAESLPILTPDHRTPEQKRADQEAALQRVNAIFDGARLDEPMMGALYNQVLLYRSAP